MQSRRVFGEQPLGQRSGDRYQITAGLQDGERIVDDGGIFLQFMQSQ